MVNIENISNTEPYNKFKDLFNKAQSFNQASIEAMLIASYDPSKTEIDARFVNCKFIEDEEFIFFSNYKSPKAQQFQKHNQISVVFYWSSIDVQIRMKGCVKKTSRKYSLDYFSSREESKNALAISSSQSKKIDSYDSVIEKYNKSLKNDDLKTCPSYWGGFSFKPYYFEFWSGNKNRINKREIFSKSDNFWEFYNIQP